MADPVPGTIHVLGPLAAVWALAVILPGPNFLVIVWTGATGGRRPALLAAAGVVTGAAFWIAAIFPKQSSACPSTVAGIASSGSMPSWPEQKTSRVPGGTSIAWL